MQKSNKIAVTLIKSLIGRKPDHKQTVAGLGLRKIRQTVVLENNASTLGMVNKVSYLLSVQPV